jgi:ribonuclease R
MVHRILKAALRGKNEGSVPIPQEKAPLALTFSSAESADDEADVKTRRELRRAKRGAESQIGEPSQVLYSPEALESIAVHSSEMERRSDEAERELIDLKKLEFMADKLGEEFEGIVIHLTKEGMVVELMELFVEGFVRLTSLDDDDYQLRDRPLALVGRVSKNVYRLGDRLKVSVDRIDRFRRRVDLSVVERLSASRREERRR